MLNLLSKKISRWNTARVLASFLQRNSDLYLGRSMLELGAGGGLPGLVTAKCGARKVLSCLPCAESGFCSGPC